MTTAPKPLRPNPQVLLTELGDGTGVLLHLETKFYFTLNSTAVAVWKALEQAPATEAALAETLVREFEVELETAQRDVAELVRELVDEELLLRGGP